MILTLLLAQATPYPGGDFMYSAGKCLEMVQQAGAVHWGLDVAECSRLSKLNSLLNRTYQSKLRSLPSVRRLRLRNSQRAWLLEMNDRCGMDMNAEIVDEATAECFSTSVLARIEVLKRFS